MPVTSNDHVTTPATGRAGTPPDGRGAARRARLRALLRRWAAVASGAHRDGVPF